MLAVGGEQARRVLILVRHGEAMSEVQDPSRPLTERGRRQAQIAGRWLARRGFTTERILHSTKLRARQTAEIIAAELQPKPPLEQTSGLAPNDDVSTIADRLERDEYRSIMIVGHLPFLARLVGYLTVGDTSKEFTGFEPCAIALLCELDGEWTLWALIQPKWAESGLTTSHL